MPLLAMSEFDAVDVLVAADLKSVHSNQRRGVELLVSRDGETAVVQLKVQQKTNYQWGARRLRENAQKRVLVVVPVASRGPIDAAERDRRLGVVSFKNRLLIWNREEIHSVLLNPVGF